MIVQGDCLEVLRDLPDATFTAIVTDPPYGLGFMGKEWDNFKPGHRADSWPGYADQPKTGACMHAGKYDLSRRGMSGFQESMRIWSVEALRVLKPGGHALVFGGTRTFHRLACALEDAGFEIRDCLMWLTGQGFPKSKNIEGGYGTALKPAWEPIILARKPLGGTVERNCREHGTGALNIDGCRIGTEARHNPPVGGHRHTMMPYKGKDGPGTDVVGRWPANLVLDEAAAEQLGGASRFFYCAKSSKADRGEGNTHPTVKPVELMRWLVRLVKGPGENLILDPFAGSGTTGVAAQLEDVPFLLIEREAAYVAMAEARLASS